MVRNFMFLAVGVVLGSQVGLASSKRFEYRLHAFPATEQTCQGYANGIAEKFTAATQAPVVRSYCQSTFSGQLDIVITYAAESELMLVSTKDQFEPDQGLYQTAQECQANLGPATEEFRINTGLEPVVSYCYLNSGISGYPHPYGVRIDSFGATKMWPKTQVWRFYGKPLFNQSTFADFVKNRAVSMGIPNAKVAFDYPFTNYRIMLSYYSPTSLSLPIELQKQGMYDTAAVCQSRQQGVYEVLKAANAEPLVVFCAEDNYSNLVSLYALTYARSSFGSEYVGGVYPSLQACDADQDRMAQLYQINFGKEVVGGICSLQSEDRFRGSGFYMKLFFR